MLGTEDALEMSDLVAWAGRDRASKVAAAAATIAHGWDRLPASELARLEEALDDHARAYVEWLADVTGATSTQMHAFRGVLTTILNANALLRDATDPAVRRRLAEMLGRAAHSLVVNVDDASRVHLG